MSADVLRRLTLLALLAAALLGTAGLSAQAQIFYDVTINTTGLSGTDGGLAFDFLGGDSVGGNNTATISNFATNGTLTGSQTNTADASGSLPGNLSLTDSGFTESFRGITFGSSVSFTVRLTENFAAPGAPDAFSFFLTNDSNTATVVPTSDPTGADALFLLEANGLPGGHLTVFTNTSTQLNVSWTVVPRRLDAVPEPSALAFALTGAGMLTGPGVFRRLRRR